MAKPGFYRSRFYLVFNTSTLLLVLLFLLIPVVAVFSKLEQLPQDDRTQALVLILIIAALTSAALFYAIRKGDLSWLSKKDDS